ncbi:MAG: CCA tRNA nucleotidyltransferase [Alphaproteobacteria bacterium]|nr:CCA tRNA nucleotidyltransferase [Alphaproteobacteria bacterium]
MDAVQTIDIPDWASSEQTQKVMRAIDGLDAEPQSLFVGGCVRNTLMGKPVSDIDIATKLLPEEVTKRLEKAGIKVVPTGVEHGTVTAIIDKKIYEITTLRKDIETDGRHAVVGYSECWKEDAQRRDFTINTLLMNCEGGVYDPLANGLKDIEKSAVVFVGNPEQRIQEDYLRILRFFRFYSQYGKGAPNTQGLQACARFADQIPTLSRERITQEFLKILAVNDVEDTIQIMLNNSVLVDVIDARFDADVLKTLNDLQEKYKASNIMARLFVVAGCRARLFEERMRLSHEQKKNLIKIEMLKGSVDFSNEKFVKKAIFYHGNALLLQGYLLSIATGSIQEEEGLADIIAHWQAPECPITGQTLIDEGYETSPELGRELEYRQEEWLDENL